MVPTEQQEAILNHSAHAVVIATPGSGKTFVLSELIKKKLKNLKDYEGVIAISFTNKASSELRNRALSNGENPKSSFFGTIDKFYLAEIIIPFAKQLFGLPNGEIKIVKLSSLPAKIESRLTWLSESNHGIELNALELQSLRDMYIRGAIAIEAIGVFAAYVINKSVSCRKYIVSKYNSIFIDEYQDAGYHQHRVLLTMKDLGLTAVVVGDLNQSIYEFSGKSAMYLAEITQNPDFLLFQLDRNHRCHPSIINYSSRLLNSNSELLECNELNVVLRHIAGNEESIAKWVDNKIDAIIDKYKLSCASDVAILTRNIRTAEILSSSLVTPHKLFITTELDVNLNIWSSIFSSLLYFVFDRKQKFIDVIGNHVDLKRISTKKLRDLIIFKNNLESSFKKDGADISKATASLIGIADIVAPKQINRESVRILKDTLNSTLLLNSYRPAQENELNILTLHKSKGLEYHVIIHLDLYEWVFPAKEPGENNDFRNPIYKSWNQDINLHYVGITRAKTAAILVTSSQRTNKSNEIKSGKPSEFLEIQGLSDLRRG